MLNIAENSLISGHLRRHIVNMSLKDIHETHSVL